MNFFLWAGLICLSCAWLFNLRLFTSAQPAWWIALLALGIACNVAAFSGKVLFRSFDKKYLLLLVPLLLTVLILPVPCSLGIMVTGAGIIMLLLCQLAPVISPVASGLIVSGVILIAQSPLGCLYEGFTSYSHYFFWLDSLLHRIFTFLGLTVWYSQHVFYIQTIKEVYPFPTTWEKLALFPLLNIFAGSIPLLYLFSNRLKAARTVIKLFLTGAAWLVLRYCFLILVFIYLMTFVKYKEEVLRVDIFWDGRITLLSFIPLIFFLCVFIPLKIQEAGGRFTLEKTVLCLKDWKSVIYVSVALFFLGWFWGFQDPGKEKQGRVLLDEKHSEWEKSTKKMDTEWYGNESGYNFYWMAEYINHFFPLTRNFEEITPALMSKFDILIIKTPTAAFSQAEISAIKDFVKQGGGLYLIGEHTNVFGTSTYLNAIAGEFGFSFRYDVLFDIERKFEQLYVPPRLLPHPVVQNMPWFAFKVSCSIQPVSSRCEGVIVASGIKALDIFYPSGNFYPPVKDHTDMPFGSFCQMAGIKEGRGRVLAFTDSTSYSNFEAFFTGKPELLLGALAWLNRENQWQWLSLVFLIIAAVCCAAGLRSLQKIKPGPVVYLFMVVLGAFFFSAALFICDRLSRAAYPIPQPKVPYTRVVFEQEHGDYELPLKGFTKEHAESYEVFFLWVLRVGLYPFAGRTLEEDIKDASMLIIINPVKTFSARELSLLQRYVEAGGKLLVMDHAANSASTANAVLEPFGMSIQKDRKATLPAPYGSAVKFYAARSEALAVAGGTSLLASGEGLPILSAAKKGKGMVAVLTFSRLFVNTGMGGSYRAEPNQELRKIYDLQFDILRGLSRGNLETYFKK